MSKRSTSDDTEELDLSDPQHPQNLQENARAYFKNAERFRRSHQERSMRKAYEQALEYGEASNTPEGLAIAAECSLYLGHIYKTRDALHQAIEYYERSIELARKSGTSAGFYVGARAAWNLGNTYEESGMNGLEAAFREAIDFGRESKIPEGLEVAAKAAFNLAANLEPDNVKQVAETWREAIDLGIESGTSDGKHVAERAKHYLSELENAK